MLTRTLRPGSPGKDVEASKRAVYRYLGGSRLRTLMSRPVAVRRTFGAFFTRDVLAARRRLRLPARPQVDAAMWQALERAGAPDAYAEQLLAEYQAEHKPKPPPPKPVQGPPSLHRSLWPLWQLAREQGFTNLGDYNPASRLPSGAPSDHAVYPARAFDSGFSPATGYANYQARKLFDAATNDSAVEYVILGDRIWTRQGGRQTYSFGGHEGHVHCSGRRSLWARARGRMTR